jgi:hypothetical protein
LAELATAVHSSGNDSQSSSDRPSNWYLGLDIGTTGISAVLLDRCSDQLYPLYWTDIDNIEVQQPRLPTAVSLSLGSEISEFLLRDFKPYLKLGIPHYSPFSARWEPVLQWSESQVPLSWIHQALQGLLLTLSSQSEGSSPYLCGAQGLEDNQFEAIMQQLAGVIVGYPANWSDTYSFNVREAILGIKLVAHPDQIFFVEEAIAALLSVLRPPEALTIANPQAHLYDANWQGGTLILNAGATVTELALVNLTEELADLSYTDFHLRSLPYAGTSLDQDIILQMLYPALDQAFEIDLAHQVIDVRFESLALNRLDLSDLSLPAAGDFDVATRSLLQQRLESTPEGQTLLAAARALKNILLRQNRCVMQFGERGVGYLRQDLASLVLLPYVQRLNRELNTLLGQTEMSVLAINQVLCTGGSSTFRAIARWLKQKFPNATIIQDTYPLVQDNFIPICSRVAYGLAVLPLYDQVLDSARHQYNDYFLLLELLRVFPNHTVSAAEIMEFLEQRGIDTHERYLHILALLEGHLPPGFVPSDQDSDLLVPETAAHPDYQAIKLGPLFYKQPGQTYRPNRHQWNHFRRYFDTLLASTHQELAQPLKTQVLARRFY